LQGVTVSNQFTLDIQRFVDKAKGNLDLVVRKVALDLFRRVIQKSPVDTGRFKGHWQVAIGSVPAGTLVVNDKAGTATMARVTAATLQLVAGQTITLVNNLSYARRLEYGYSKQAPGGMVRITVQEFGAVARKAAAEVRNER
jgi:hypothetical protein